MAGLGGAAKVLLSRQRDEIFELTEDHERPIRAFSWRQTNAQVNSEFLSVRRSRLEIPQVWR